jgi:hypothetical protein
METDNGTLKAEIDELGWRWRYARGNGMKRIATLGLSLIGLVSIILFVGGMALDAGGFDNTEGGYEAPYEGWTGTPTDWAAGDTTPTGMARRGYVANLLVDCTTGMISFQIYGQTIPFRPFSPRALAVHQPREACIERGFDPAF